jgi:hypothetical protein
MHTIDHHLESLEARAGRGDRTASADLRRELEPQLLHIVRSTLRRGETDTPLARCVMAEAYRHKTDPRLGRFDSPESLIAAVARRVCDAVVSQASAAANPRRWLQETVASA